jgi:hypothetical protein
MIVSSLSEIHHFNSKGRTFPEVGDVKVDRVITKAQRILALECSQLVLERFSIELSGDTIALD